ncbi:MAG TPA: DUF6677 family protein [Gemmataceae bacterium]|nr:DUF6677 family protein [Gemmataceae bacterium]
MPPVLPENNGSPAPAGVVAHKVKLDPLAALLGFLIPGLGQVYQGRTGKGLLFFFGLYGLFFYGMWMGKWKNVWLPDVSDQPPLTLNDSPYEGVPSALYYRPQYLGQFWIGVAAWPAAVQYRTFDKDKGGNGVFRTFQRAPSEEELNDLQRNGNKRWDLGWVYTVIAGVLNLLVIYDAFAGPMFRDPPPGKKEDEDESRPQGDPPQPPAARSESAEGASRGAVTDSTPEGGGS